MSIKDDLILVGKPRDQRDMTTLLYYRLLMEKGGRELKIPQREANLSRFIDGKSNKWLVTVSNRLLELRHPTPLSFSKNFTMYNVYNFIRLEWYKVVQL